MMSEIMIPARAFLEELNLCGECGAVVYFPDKHREFHVKISAALAKRAKAKRVRRMPILGTPNPYDASVRRGPRKRNG